MISSQLEGKKQLMICYLSRTFSVHLHILSVWTILEDFGNRNSTLFYMFLTVCFHYSRFLNYSWTSIINLLISNKASARIMTGIVYNILTAWKTIKFFNLLTYRSGLVQFSSVAQSRPTLCDPMDCSTPGTGGHDWHTYHGREELPHVRGHGQKPGGPHAWGEVAERCYPMSEVRSSGQECRKWQCRNGREEVPHVRG